MTSLFLNPWLLLGAAGVAVPIVVHLFTRHRHRVIDWAAMHLLRNEVAVRTRQIKVEDKLLLLLRCLAVILIALFMARPILRSAGSGRPLNAGVVCVLDTSASMRAMSDEETSLELSKGRLREIADELPAGTPFVLCAVDDRVRVVYDGPLVKSRLEQVIDGIEASDSTFALHSALDAVSDLLDHLKAPSRSVVILTDGQQQDWHDGLASDISDRFADRASVRFCLAAKEDRDNLAVVNLRHVGGRPRIGGSVSFATDVTNFGPNPAANVEVALFVNDKPVDREVVSRLDAGANTVVTLTALLSSGGDNRVSARLVHDDTFQGDNEQRIVLRVPEQLRILFVRGVDASTDMLGAAMNPGGQDASISVTPVSWLTLPQAELDDVDVVLLYDVPQVTRADCDRLHRFVQNGGNLLIYVGEQADPNAYNENFLQHGEQWLPGRLQATSAGDASFHSTRLAVSPGLRHHPVAHVIRSLSREVVAAARIHKIVSMDPHHDGVVLLRVDEGDRPLLVESRVGSGTVFMMTTTLDRTWSDLALTPVHVVLLHQMLARSADRPGGGSFVVGHGDLVPLDSVEGNATVNLESSSLTLKDVAVKSPDGPPRLNTNVIRKQGFYDVKSGGESRTTLAFNAAPDESDLRLANFHDAVNSVALSAASVLSPDQALPSNFLSNDTGFDLTTSLLVAAIAIVVLEQFLAARTVRAGSEETVPAVVSTPSPEMATASS